MNRKLKRSRHNLKKKIKLTKNWTSFFSDHCYTFGNLFPLTSVKKKTNTHDAWSKDLSFCIYEGCLFQTIIQYQLFLTKRKRCIHIRSDSIHQLTLFLNYHLIHFYSVLYIFSYIFFGSYWLFSDSCLNLWYVFIFFYWFNRVG